MLAELTTWPDAAIYIAIITAATSIWVGTWPWQKVDVHYECDCECKECKPDEDDET